MTDEQPILKTPPRPYDYETVDDLEDTNFIRALIYGPPKVGKSALAMSFPNPAIADFDGYGVKVAKSPWFKKTYPDQLKPGVLRFKQFGNQLDDIGLPMEHDAFHKAMAWLNAVLADPGRETIVLDSLTMLSVAALYAALPAMKKRKRSKTWEHAQYDQILLLTQQDFGAEMGVVEQLLDQLHKIHDKHVLVLAHEREQTTDSGSVSKVSPLITGAKLRAKIAHWFDEVYYMESYPNGQRLLRCQPHGVLHGIGSRLGLPAEIPDPSYKKIITHLKEGR